MRGLEKIGTLFVLGWITECDREEQGAKCQSEDEDVREGFHRGSPKCLSAKG